MSIQRYSVDSVAGVAYPYPDDELGEFVRFDDHEAATRELLSSHDWQQMVWEKEQLRQSFATARALLRDVQLDHSRALIDIGEDLERRIVELIGPHPRDGQ